MKSLLSIFFLMVILPVSAADYKLETVADEEVIVYAKDVIFAAVDQQFDLEVFDLVELVEDRAVDILPAFTPRLLCPFLL